jgi:hypothetical protein
MVAREATNVTDRYVALPLDGAFHGTHGGYTNHGCRCAACTGAATTAKRDATERRAARLRAGERIEHGLNGYTNYLCRCEVCKAAHAKQQRERRETLQSEPVPERVHGTLNGYNYYSCRCLKCRVNHAEYQAAYYQQGRVTSGPGEFSTQDAVVDDLLC